MFEKLFAHSGLSLDRLRSFLEIVTAGGISAAAKGDSNRQSQYSRQGQRSPSDILDGLALAMLEGSPSTWQAIEREARKRKLRLNVRLRLSSYPQLVQAVRCLGLAAILPTLAGESLEADHVQLRRLPVLDSLAREILLVWNAKASALRPSPTRYAKRFTRVLR